MAWEQNLLCATLPAGADLSAKQFYAVKVASGKLALCGAGAQGVGVLQDKPNADGVAGNFAFGGVSKIALGGTVTSGQMLASDSAGKFVAAASGDIAMGIAITGGSSGEIGNGLIFPVGKVW